MPFDVKQVDRAYYAERIADFLPRRIIDAHTHIWLKSFVRKTEVEARTANWPRLVAADSSFEDLMATYRLMLPEQEVTPLMFGWPERQVDLQQTNGYVSRIARQRGLPCLLVSTPEWSAVELERQVAGGDFLGLKPYLSFAPVDIKSDDVTIYDFLPHEQLEAANAHGWIVMLHIPRPARLKDPVNLQQMLEIERRYPQIRLIYPHIGRAYCAEDLGDALDVLQKTEHLLFDFSANTNAEVFERYLRAFGPGRLLFGSDLPVARMRMRRICEEGVYINLVPPGLYGDVSGDPHMREVDREEGERLSFFLYEELWAFRRAAEAVGLSTTDVEDVFYNNAARLIGMKSD
jgi:predicted TIM-barrel fold metal-dependent hydrolase